MAGLFSPQPISNELSADTISESQINLAPQKTVLLLEYEASQLQRFKTLLIHGLKLDERQIRTVRSSQRLLAIAFSLQNKRDEDYDYSLALIG